ncbi:cytochrome b/b6 domain-containing protein [Novosphingobium album (ex Liu et al. 2023)]|uniref:Cytochrome b/b6 domain-containing protein n=1 Tax=Novosphingobium album (ex Liu et al. 2023) TaxID=3031130 RepID=A0ABT5WR71_9SPHN|nr:cytochrome b/b6 domain-containing protein [Novosphingobium album (ex Liu et al. 2023)]MDE8652539.1 cytochrome b/b6 domain-containing protein [Novosphingobium album (ex Liu et al. 2023)]
MTDTAASASAPRFARIWDAPVRLFHWLLVALIAFSWWSGEQHEMDWHRLSGYSILALLVFRLFWGFAGSRTARFAQFVRGPGAVLAYARNIGRRPYAGSDGHNALGGWSVILLLAAIAAMVTAGLFAVDVDGLESGPLADYVSFDQGRAAAEVHEAMFNVLLALIALHVLAILFYLVWHRRNLIRPMVSGRRALDATEAASDLRWSPWKAALGVVLAAACAYAVSQGLRF